MRNDVTTHGDHLRGVQTYFSLIKEHTLNRLKRGINHNYHSFVIDRIHPIILVSTNLLGVE